jgi:2-polyprenyl-3-methyl-5-hydroxy-6-metoxy-1,4-benzoquinol methylase
MDFSMTLPKLSDGQIVKDFAEFSGLGIDKIVKNIQSYKKINMQDFTEKATKEEFYENSKTYAFDLLSVNWSLEVPPYKVNRFLPNCLENIKSHPGKRFLEFGGGLGVFSEFVKRYTSKNVTYLDVNGYVSEFAQWRFKKYGIDINLLLTSQDDFKLPHEYDIIFTDAVFEHLDPQQQLRYAKKLTSYLADGGMIVFLVDLGGHEENMPMHYDVDIKSLHNVFEESGLKNLVGVNSFASVWGKNCDQKMNWSNHQS